MTEREVYAAGLEGLDETALLKEANQFIWLSAYAANNPRSAYHWKCDAVAAECRRRERMDIYERAHRQVGRELGYA